MRALSPLPPLCPGLARLMLGMVLAAAVLSGLAPARADVPIGEDRLRRGTIAPSEEIFRRLFEDEAARQSFEQGRAARQEGAPPQRRVERRVVGVRIIEVAPGEGNNPLNQRQPLNNTTLDDGRVVLVAPDEVEDGGAGPGGGQGALEDCLGLVNAAPSGTAPTGFLFTNMRINLVTGACTHVSGGNSASVIWQVEFESASGGELRDISVFTDKSGPFGDRFGPFVEVSPANGFGQFGSATVTQGAVETLVIQDQTSGRRFQIQFVVQVTGADATVNIVDIREI